MPADEIKKLHIHLGHADKLSSIRTLRAGKVKVGNASMEKVLNDCPFGIAIHGQIQPPVVGPHRVTWAGHTVMADIWYLVEEDARPPRT